MTAADDARLRHMRDAARAVLQFMTGRERADLDTDIMLAFAVTRGLEIVGEAAKNVSPELKAAHPDVPWREIGRARDLYAHGYFVLDMNRIWAVVHDDLPPLLAQLDAIWDEEI